MYCDYSLGRGTCAKLAMLDFIANHSRQHTTIATVLVEQYMCISKTVSVYRTGTVGLEIFVVINFRDFRSWVHPQK